MIETLNWSIIFASNFRGHVESKIIIEQELK